MKRTKLIVGVLAAVLIASGANAESLKEIENAASKDVETVQSLRAQIAEIEKRPEYKKLTEANKSASNCAAYEDALYLNKVCTTENPCDTKNSKLKSACDNTFSKINLNNDTALIRFIITSINPECVVAEETTDIKAGRNAGDFVRCKNNNKVYKFHKLNATTAKNGKDGQVAALCIVLGGKPGGNEKSSNGAKWLGCAGISEDKCSEAKNNGNYPRDLYRETYFDSNNGECSIRLNS
ncbi:MAG: hypothetical protein LBJ73_03740 [Rickettsiales bacterium]|jgi:hypothetical protein|nr:hypothetical protein [Rickettsiales bacterium]